ncbi:MAG: EamA family transporter [Nocardioides sp.]|uniref:EamA family transporter n=1 Tax=Nocardioides sp. TaxID=35761 RepID=UPI0039E2ED41
MSVLLSLLAAASYGLSDFLGGLVSKRAGAWPVAFVAQVGTCVVLLTVGLLTPGSPTLGDFGWAVAAGVANGSGTAFLYRGLAAGRMGVVAPVSGVGAALVPVMIALVLGERPAPPVWAGIIAAGPGIWLVSREAPQAGTDREPRGGLLDGVLAGLGFGSLFAILAQIPPEAGLFPLALNQAVAAIAVIATAVAVGGDWVPRQRIALVGVVSGCLGAVATFAFLVASNIGYLSIAAVLTALYPAGTVLLAALVLHEHIHRGQAAGLALCGLAVTLVAAG